MATFKTQIENLTKLDTTGDESKITQWLVDGVREVVNRISNISPGEIVKFTKSSSSPNNDELVVTGKLLSVMRNHFKTLGRINQLRKATLIDPNNRADALDKTSLYYRSEYNPGYYIMNGKINVVPIPDSNNYIELAQIAYDSDVTYASESISDFPYEYEHLIVQYAAIKVLFRHLTTVEETMGTMTLPDIPTAPVNLDNLTDINHLTIPEFTAPQMSYLDWTDTNNWISTEEDSEMLASRMSEIDGKLKEYGTLLETEKTKFEEANTKFQAELQIAIENTRSENEKDTRALQIFSQEVIRYQQEVTKEIQRYQYEVITKATKKYEWVANRYSGLVKDYTDAFALMGNIQKQSQPKGDK